MSLADYDKTWQIVERPVSVSAKSTSSKSRGQTIPSIAVEDLVFLLQGPPGLGKTLTAGKLLLDF